MLALVNERRTQGERGLRRTEPSRPVAARPPFRAFVIVAVLAVVAVGFVWLRSGAQNTSKELQAQQRKLALQSQELENLQVQLEAYTSGSYILRKSRKLGLHPPLPGQVRRVRVRSVREGRPGDEEGESLMASWGASRRDAE